MDSLTERYDERIAGVLSCYDRVVVTGTLPGVCYAEGMTRYLYANNIRIFDYPQFAATLRDAVRSRAAAVAAQAGIRPNDEIVAVGGQKLYHPQHLLEWEQANPGKPLPLTIFSFRY